MNKDQLLRAIMQVYLDTIDPDAFEGELGEAFNEAYFASVGQEIMDLLTDADPKFAAKMKKIEDDALEARDDYEEEIGAS